MNSELFDQDGYIILDVWNSRSPVPTFEKRVYSVSLSIEHYHDSLLMISGYIRLDDVVTGDFLSGNGILITSGHLQSIYDNWFDERAITQISFTNIILFDNTIDLSKHIIHEDKLRIAKHEC